MVVYDPRYHTFQSWTALMCEAYADQQLIIGDNENDWIKWAERFVGVLSSGAEGVPMPSLFQRWDEWAVALYNVTNGGNNG